MANKIGDSEKSPRSGGETWTIVWNNPPQGNQDVGLVKGERFRLEDNGNSDQTVKMYPDEGTKLFGHNNKVIVLTRQGNSTPAVYHFKVKLDGNQKDLWWNEGPPFKSDATNPIGEDEGQIWVSDPTKGGAAPGGSAGARR
jgi:hypothetical protein